MAAEDWRKQLRKASFRGLPFLYKDTDGEFGQNTVTHIFPFKKDPIVEFMGRKPRNFKMNGYLFGDTVPGMTHIQAANAFIEAVENPSPAKFVHPHFGDMRVSVVNFTGPRISTDEGGIARFVLEVVVTDNSEFIVASVSTTVTVLDKADAANAALQSSFGSTFSVLNKAAYVANEAAKVVNGISDKLSQATSLVTGLPTAANGLVSSLEGLSGSVSSLILSPVDLAAKTLAIFGALSLAAAGPGEAINILKGYFGFGTDADPDTALDPVPTTTPNRVAQAANQAALVNLVRQGATIEAIRQSAQLEFESAQQAAALRQQLQGQLDALMDDADDTMFQALMALRAAMQKDITTRGADLAQIVTHQPNMTMPASLIAFRLYGDSSRADEIVARNGLAMPAFVPAGTELEVLSE